MSRNYEQWSEELIKISMEDYGYNKATAEDLAVALKDYFDDDYSPREAIISDLSYA